MSGSMSHLWEIRRIGRWSLGVVACALLATPVPSGAQANSVAVSVEVIGGETTLVVSAGNGAGTVNRIGVNPTSNGMVLTVSEGGFGQIIVGPGCTKRPGQQVADCSAAGVTHARIILNDGADFLDNNTQLTALTFGGSGNDELRVGCSNNAAFGEDGNDTIIAEGFCGIFPGTLFCANPFHNCLNGGPGNDTIRGPQANSRDRLSGDGGSDDLFGRNGADLLLARDGVNGETVDCGTGSPDVVERDAGDTGPGCEVFQ